VTSIDRYCHFWDGAINVFTGSYRRPLKVEIITRCRKSTFNFENSEPKEDERVSLTTVGLPKNSNVHGNRVVIVPYINPIIRGLKYVTNNIVRKGSTTVGIPCKKRYYSTGCTTQTSPDNRGSNVVKKLQDLKLRCISHPHEIVDRNLIKLVSDLDLLIIAYDNIKSKPGNMTPSTHSETLDGISKEWFETISNKILDESFRFSPARRINIPKASGGTRPLMIAPPRDKIVQEALRIILEAIYEPIFLDSSHGFRSNKSCHTALKSFYNDFKHSQWLIEGDISKCFDCIDHHRLMKLIEDKIKDRKFTRLISKSLKAGYFEFRVLHNNIAGTPQGSIISPILANIFLHQLDTYVAKLKDDFDKGIKAGRNPVARKIEHLVR
jgi:retron-type reverse transcriptase